MFSCPECGRPLQRNRDICIYCGYRLNENELEEVAKVLNSEAVREAEKAAADALLNLEPSSTVGATGRLVAKISVITLSVAAVIFLSWVSEWNPVIILSSGRRRQDHTACQEIRRRITGNW